MCMKEILRFYSGFYWLLVVRCSRSVEWTTFKIRRLLSACCLRTQRIYQVIHNMRHRFPWVNRLASSFYQNGHKMSSVLIKDHEQSSPLRPPPPLRMCVPCAPSACQWRVFYGWEMTRESQVYTLYFPWLFSSLKLVFKYILTYNIFSFILLKQNGSRSKVTAAFDNIRIH
jgi:hypothetical protein